MSETKRVEPLVLIFSGPSGSGKSTLVQKSSGAAGDDAQCVMYHQAT